MRDKRVSGETGSSVIGVKRETKGGPRGGCWTGKDKETEERNRGRINREERDHAEHLNPRKLSAVALYLPPLSSCYIS